MAEKMDNGDDIELGSTTPFHTYHVSANVLANALAEVFFANGFAEGILASGFADGFFANA